MVVERVAHTIKLAYVMVVSSVEGGGPKTRVGTAARGHGELCAEIARFAQIAQIARLTAQVPTPPGDHHHPCPKVRIPIVACLLAVRDFSRHCRQPRPMVREVITVQVGQCGKQIGSRFWSLDAA